MYSPTQDSATPRSRKHTCSVSLRPAGALTCALILYTFPVLSPDAAGQTWFAGLPAAERNSILWKTDHESGDLRGWTDKGFQSPGGGIYNTGGTDVEAAATRQPAHSGNWSARATIRGAIRGQHGSRAVRLMRWTNAAWDAGGQPLPREAYFSAWYYIPTLYNPNKYGDWARNQVSWWNIFQFKDKDQNGQSQPLWTVNLLLDEDAQQLCLSLYSPRNTNATHHQPDPVFVPVGKWFHLEVLYRCATDATGRITLWQDGQQLLDVSNVVTSLGGRDGQSLHPTWGVGSYTDHVEALGEAPGTATIYIDDAAVSTRRLSTNLENLKLEAVP